MATNNNVNLSGMGGLTRYSEEYNSVFMLRPSHVVAFIIAIIILRVALPVFLR